MGDAHEEALEATEIKDRKIALLISLLALCLAFAETGSKSTQTEVLSTNVETADLWAFYQAKTIRQTVIQTGIDALSVQKQQSAPPSLIDSIDRQMAVWRTSIDKLETDPKGENGRKELVAKAQEDERRRDALLGANHQYELSAAALQIAIVLASASIITEMSFLAIIGGGLGLLGAGLSGLAFFSNTGFSFL